MGCSTVVLTYEPLPASLRAPSGSHDSLLGEFGVGVRCGTVAKAFRLGGPEGREAGSAPSGPQRGDGIPVVRGDSKSILGA